MLASASPSTAIVLSGRLRAGVTEVQALAARKHSGGQPCPQRWQRDSNPSVGILCSLRAT
jgi:hypothetical protein